MMGFRRHRPVNTKTSSVEGLRQIIEEQRVQLALALSVLVSLGFEVNDFLG